MIPEKSLTLVRCVLVFKWAIHSEWQEEYEKNRDFDIKYNLCGNSEFLFSSSLPIRLEEGITKELFEGWKALDVLFLVMVIGRQNYENYFSTHLSLKQALRRGGIVKWKFYVSPWNFHHFPVRLKRSERWETIVRTFSHPSIKNSNSFNSMLMLSMMNNFYTTNDTNNNFKKDNNNTSFKKFKFENGTIFFLYVSLIEIAVRNGFGMNHKTQTFVEHKDNK
jgi:hypothetical protein